MHLHLGVNSVLMNTEVCVVANGYVFVNSCFRNFRELVCTQNNQTGCKAWLLIQSRIMCKMYPEFELNSNECIY